MKNCERCNVRKQREINNGEKYIILYIYYKLGCMDKREVTSSESKNCMGRPGKKLNTSLDISTKRSNKKQKAKFAITDITNQDFRKLLKKFNNSPYLG